MHDSCPSPGPTAAIDLGGTIRTVGAEVTLSRARRILHDVGITRIGNVTGLDHVGVPTWMVSWRNGMRYKRQPAAPPEAATIPPSRTKKRSSPIGNT